MKPVRRVAQIILVRKDGALLLQRRDDKPGITNPGLISAFGGSVEPGEEPIDGAIREISEETNLMLDKTALRFLGIYRKNQKEHGEDAEVCYFMADHIDDADLKVREGQGYRVVESHHEATKLPLTTLLRRVLDDYYKGLM